MSESQSPEKESSSLKVDTVETAGAASSSPSKVSVVAPAASGQGNQSNNANTNAASQNLAENIKETFKSFGSKKYTKPLIIHRDANSIIFAGHQLMYKTPRVSSIEKCSHLE